MSKREAQRVFDALRGHETRTERVAVGLTPGEMEWLDALMATGFFGTNRAQAFRIAMLNEVERHRLAGTIKIPQRFVAIIKEVEADVALRERKVDRTKRRAVGKKKRGR